MTNLPPPPPGAPTPPPPGQPPYGGYQGSGNPKADAKAAKAYAKASRPFYAKKRFWLLGVVALIVIVAVASSGGSKDDDKKVDTAGATVDDKADGAKDSGARDNDGSDLAESSGSTHDPKDDVEITSCAKDDILGAKVGLKVTNHSSDPSNYMIEVKLESPDGKTSYGTANAFIQSLNNGQTKDDEAVSLDDLPDGVEFKCTLADVTRLAA